MGCLAEQHSQYVAVDDVKLNGELTAAENTADAAGLRLALEAFRDTSIEPATIRRKGGRLHAGAAVLSELWLTWCTHATPASLRDAASNDFHASRRNSA